MIAIETEPQHAATQQDLADIFGVHKSTIRDYRQRGAPGRADGRYDVAAWREWVAANIDQPEMRRGGDTSELDRKRQLECELLEERRRKLQIANDLAASELVLRCDVTQLWNEGLTRIKDRLQAIPEETTMLIPTEQRAAVQADLTHYVQQLLTEMSQWQPPGKEIEVDAKG